MRFLVAIFVFFVVFGPAAFADDWVPVGSLRLHRGEQNQSGSAVDSSQFSAPSRRSSDLDESSVSGGNSTNDNPEAGQFVVDVHQFSSPAPRNDASNLPGMPIQGGLERAATTFIKRLAGRDLQVLSTRDVIVLIDKSGSMADKDCPPPLDGLRFLMRNGESPALISRWEWCEQELVGLSRNAVGALPNGIRLVLFDGHQIPYDHVSINQIPQIFQNEWPEGSTNEAAALKNELESYFARKSATGGRVRPIVIAVITDGLPNSVSSLKKAIIDATRAMTNPSEIAITFLQIGKDPHGVKLVHELDDKLVQEGAIYDVVDCKDFSELQRIGLAHALVDAINEAGYEGAAGR